MKKFFILCLMAFVMCVNANAQNDYGFWHSSKVEKDELRGYEERVMYSFSEMSPILKETWNTFVFTSDGIMSIRLTKYKSFVSSFYIRNDKPHTDILVGLYSADGNLIEKFTLSCKCNKQLNSVYINDNKDKIFNTLKGDGYVRFVGENLDFIVNNFSTPFGKEFRKECEDMGSQYILETWGIKHDIVFNIN